MEAVLEVWQPVLGYAGAYLVSDQGRVMNARTGRVLSPATVKKSGHKRVALSLNGVTKFHYVHRLVITSFHGPMPPGYETRHKNDVPSDNRLVNLCIGTHADNMQDASRRGRWLNAKPSKLTPSDVRAIREMATAGVDSHLIALGYDVSVFTIRRVVNGTTWKGV